MTCASESLRAGTAPTRPTPDLESLEQPADAGTCVVDPRTLGFRPLHLTSGACG
jgi:hypothetical protein